MVVFFKAGLISLLFSGVDIVYPFSNFLFFKLPVYCKKELSRAIVEFLKPIQERRKYYEERPEEVEKILKEGTEATRRKAMEVMKKVREAMKLDYFE